MYRSSNITASNDICLIHFSEAIQQPLLERSPGVLLRVLKTQLLEVSLP